MLLPRLIPILLLDGNRLVKTINFKSPKYVGDPINTIRIFNEKEVDELILLDISASKLNKEPNYDLVEQIASECFMPLCYGGGIVNIEQARRLFQSGIEKVCVRTSAVFQPDLITNLASNFGSQAIVVSIDIVGTSLKDYDLLKTEKELTFSGSWLELLERSVASGAGEILLTSVEREGSNKGLAIDLIQEASKNLSVPLIINGGLNSLIHAQEGLTAGADAIAGGSFFVFQGKHKAVLISYPNKTELGLFDKR
jgi:cyclase